MYPLVELKSVSKYYASGPAFFRSGQKQIVKAVDQVDLKIFKGETLGVIGESGSGKSTLGRLILRLIQPSSGEIVFEGEPITNHSPFLMKRLYRKMQLVFQDSSSSFNPRKTVGEQLMAPMMRLGVASNKREALEYVTYLLEKVGLKKEHLYRYPHEFSGGQRQRLGIARALAVKPEFLVLDEPTSALDVSIQAQILNLLLDLKEEFQLTYLFIGHNLGVVHFFCDRVAVMYRGRVVEVANTHTLFTQPFHPVTKMLLKSVLSLEQPLHDEFEEKVNYPGQSKGCVFSNRCPYMSEPCLGSQPELVETSPGHHSACFYPEGGGFLDKPMTGT